MMDDIKILVDAVAQMEGGALYVLFGFLFYKLVTFGSITAATLVLGKLFLNKTHDWLITKKTVINTQELKLDNKIISDDGNYGMVCDAFVMAQKAGSGTDREHVYLHKDGCQYLFNAVKEKVEREALKENKQ